MNNNINPVICCIGYNRPESMRRLLKSIGKADYDNDDILLLISIDESKDSDSVETVAREFEWCHGEKKILRYPNRLGLKEHCLLCGDYTDGHGALIFLEDDVVVAPGYYMYVKNAAAFYADDERIMGVSLYSERWVEDLSIELIPSFNGYDVFLTQRELSHGQCWLEKSWKKFRTWYSVNQSCVGYNKNIPPCVYKWDSKSSWSKFMSYFMVEEDMYYVCPYHSYATNMSEVGTHAGKTSDICQVPLSEGNYRQFRFGQPDCLVKYDAFYERKDRFMNIISEINIDNICLDLNGQKYDWSGYNYLLTTKVCDYQLIEEFGVNMDPIENNLLYNVPGTGIRLYQIPESYKPSGLISEIEKKGISKYRISHIYNKVPPRILFSNILTRAINRLKYYFYR